MNQEIRGFVESLKEALRRGLERGRLDVEQIDDLLHAPDFDPSAFDIFLQQAKGQGVRLPEGLGADPSEASSEEDAGAHSVGDIERRYLSEIQRYPLLEREEEHRLWNSMRAGDETARKALILAYLRLVVALARGYRNRGVDFLDLVEEGNLGLITAVDRYDVERGVHFSTYASWWIRQALARGVANHARTVRIPVHVLQMARKYTSAERRLETELGRKPEVEEIAAEIGITESRTARLRALVMAIRSVDVDLSNHEYHGLIETEAMEQPPTLGEIVETQIRNQHLDELLKRLSGREEAILRLRYGFYDDRPRTLAETGEHFGLSRERIRQLEQRALEKLRQLLESEDTETPASVH
ncbi:MAG TPA: sigma-70 family RNA polymerase sigma factor [Candidatus Eisenbacteria bacterium]|jgi:RNA polymerase primary sigma factor